MIYFLKFLFTLSILCSILGHLFANRFPYTVAIKRFDDLEQVLCGGAILNERYVLTSANCVAKYRESQFNLQILAGDFDTPRRYSINKVIVHWDYLEGDATSVVLNDIALLQTQADFSFNERIQPIKIGEQAIPPDSTVIAVGYGIRRTYYERYDDLEYGEMIVEHDLLCYQNYNYQAGFLCLRHAMDPATCCSWGSGGPAVRYTKNGITLVGITSFDGSYCGGCKPYRFVNVSYYAEWINNEISE